MITPQQQVSPQQQLAPVAGELPKDRPGAPGNWHCAGCGNENWPGRKACHRCGIRRAGIPDGPGAPGNWLCVGCGNENWPTRIACNRCSAPRGVHPGGVGGMLMQMGAMGGQPGMHGGMQGGFQGGARQLMGADGIGAPGNWICVDCSNENWPKRSSCNRCGVPRPAVGAAAPPVARGEDDDNISESVHNDTQELGATAAATAAAVLGDEETDVPSQQPPTGGGEQDASDERKGTKRSFEGEPGSEERASSLPKVGSHLSDAEGADGGASALASAPPLPAE